MVVIEFILKGIFYMLGGTSLFLLACSMIAYVIDVRNRITGDDKNVTDYNEIFYGCALIVFAITSIYYLILKAYNIM